MKQCQNCGVEVDGSLIRCPLCGRALDGQESREEGDRSEDDPEHGHEQTEPRPGPRARFWLWEVVTLIIGATALIIGAADFAYGFDMSWSIFPLSGLGFLWLFLSILIWLGRDIPLAYGAAIIDTLLFLFVLDVITTGDPWFATLALPITLLVAAVGGGAAAVARALKLSVFQTIADGVLAVGIFLVGLEVVLHFALETSSILSWSIVAFAGCLSIALLLLLINRRLRQRHADFKRVFHL